MSQIGLEPSLIQEQKFLTASNELSAAMKGFHVPEILRSEEVLKIAYKEVKEQARQAQTDEAQKYRELVRTITKRAIVAEKRALEAKKRALDAEERYECRGRDRKGEIEAQDKPATDRVLRLRTHSARL